MVRLARLGRTDETRASEARVVAYRTVRRVFADGAYADRTLRGEADQLNLSTRDRGFARQLAYGTIQRRDTLDYVLGALSARPVEALDDSLRDALRIGLYQLLFMDSVPDHAAVEQTVELAKLENGRGARLANAVMRRATREAADLVGQLTGESPADAALLHSHPEWLVRLWWELLGPDEALALLRCDNLAPESAVRANELLVTAGEVRAALEAEGLSSRSAPGLPEGIVVEGSFDVHGSPLFRSGALTPQSRASMLVARVLDPRPGERVLDLCAAPGAKTTHIAALMEGRGELVAVERNPKRAGELERNLERMGADWAQVLRADATDGGPEGQFDRVLLDAPCSALGTLRSRPDARWRKMPAQIAELQELQRALLAAAAAKVRPGGTLVYSTCTISPGENEEQAGRFLTAHPEFQADDLGAEHPDLRHGADGRFLQLLPHRDGTDGFFIARFLRETA